MNGVVTLSIEIELGWGTHDLGEHDHLSERGRAERRYLRALLDRCDDLDVPITFDVVGHLLLEECDGHDATRYPEGWFDADPETDAETDPTYYAPDVVEEILSRPVDHEVGTHSFTHVLCGQVDRTTVEEELSRAQHHHRATVCAPAVSLVPPRHSDPPPDVVRANDIEIVRQSRNTRGPTPVHRYKELLMDRSMTRDPVVRDGVVETYGTSYPSLTAPALPSGRRSASHVTFRGLPVWLRQRLHRRRLVSTTEAVAADGAYLHLWTHLWDLSNEYQWPPVAAYLETLARYRDERDLSILTMRDLNDHVRDGPATPVERRTTL